VLNHARERMEATCDVHDRMIPLPAQRFMAKRAGSTVVESKCPGAAQWTGANGQVWGRPVGVTTAADGSLLVTDDGSNSIWRVSYAASSD
jgi:glucose/arabinose dehydrogenase